MNADSRLLCHNKKIIYFMYIILLVVALFFLPNATMASIAENYEPIKNQAIGSTSCLTLDKDKSRITFSPCNGSAEQHWRFTSAGGSYLLIRNASVATQCLRTFNDGRTVKLGACSGDGYTSMRQWTINNNADGSMLLANKYSKDLGRNEKLIANVATNTVSISGATSTERKAHWDYKGEIPSPKRPLLGNKRVLLMATHYNGVTPADPEPIRKAVFGDGDDYASLKHYLKLASHGKLTIDGTFLINVNIGDRPTSCSSSTILENARKAARAQGVEPNDYDFFFVDISRSSDCKWEGLASNPGNWILSNGVGYKYWMWSHEFGHNMGLRHSDTLRSCLIKDGVVQLNQDCILGGGGDATDTMGGGGGKLYPVNYQLFAAWLDDTEVPTIRDPGTYKLMPLWQPGGAQGYRIPRSDGSVLVLEFRQPRQGFESWPVDDPFVNGIIVRVARYSGNHLTNSLVDATPDSAQLMKDAPLMPGHSLYDELSRKFITVESIDSSGAVLKIENHVTRN
jgi:hypothetical protein